jgi:excisionase family DNA binding protein
LTLLNVEQVCELLQVKKSWLWGQCRADAFPHIRVGRELRFRPAEIQKWIDGACNG